jgi:peptidoglycan/xylan/chitin deacetylase (PgdA/CDA1 family)
MRKIILMYHSIKSDRVPAVLGSFAISMERFKAQILGAKARGWSFAPLSRLREPVDRDTLYITGDDGTVDWVRNVLPWCEEQGLATHTAVITGPWLENPIYPVTHRVQIALSLPNREIPQPSLTEDQTAYIDKVYHYETEPRRRYLKGACNLVLDFDEASKVLGAADFDEQCQLRKRFSTPEEYKQFTLAEVGVHTVSHRAMGMDTEDYIRKEILPCLAMLLRHDLKVTRYFTLPMRPRYIAKVEDLVQPLKKYGFHGILDSQGVWDQESYIVPRIDAKKVEEVLELEPWKGD